MSFFGNHQNTNTRNTLDPNNIYLYSFFAYNRLMEENYAIKIYQSNTRLYFSEEFRSNSVYSGTFLSYPAELCFPICHQKTEKERKLIPKECRLYQSYS